MASLIRRVIAIARNTIAQGFRMKVPLIVVAFLLIVVPILPLLVKSDGTPKGQAQIILTYSLNVASFLLCLLAVFLSVATLTSDMKGKQILMLDISPVRRWEMLLGKWLGVVMLSSFLLVAMGTTIYVLVKVVVTPANDKERMALQNEVFTARERVKPEPPDTKKMARQYFQRFKAEGRIRPEEEKKAMTRIERFCIDYNRAFLPRSPREWKFTGLHQPRTEDEMMTVRYKLKTTDKTADGTVRCVWMFGSRANNEGIRVRTKQMGGSLHEFAVPANVIAPDGTLDVSFVCFENTSGVFDMDKGLEILYRAGTFEVNFLKCLLLILLKICFLSAVGLAAGTFLTFPVASLAAFFVFGVALASGSVEGILGFTIPGYGAETPENVKEMLGSGAVRLWHVITFIIPDFGTHSGIGRCTSGEIIGCWGLLRSVTHLALIRTGILMGIGAWILSFRELAAVEE